jgi:hypothetical protein
MNLHPPMSASLRRATWPAWPRRLGTTASSDRRTPATGVRFDWPLLLFWVCYFALVAVGAWLFLR